MKIEEIRGLSPREHICLLYKSRNELTQAVVPFVQSGIENGETCIFVTPKKSPLWFHVALESGGIDVKKSLKSGSLNIIQRTPTDLNKSLINNLYFGGSKNKSFKIILDTVNKTDENVSFDEIRKLELNLNKYIEKSKSIALCLYDYSLLTPRVIEDLILMHTSVIYKNNFCRNFYHLSNNEYEDQAFKVNRMLDHLIEFKEYSHVLFERSLRYKKIYESNMIAVVFISNDGSLIEANDTFYKLSGYRETDISSGSLNWRNLVSIEDRNRIYKATLELKKSGTFPPFEINCIKKDGTKFTIMLGGAAVDKSKKEFIAYGLDLTQQKILEKRRDEFLSTASHELRTPLTTLKAFTDLLNRHVAETKDPQRFSSYLEKMDKQIIRLTSVVKDLLDVTKIKAGHLEYSDELFSIDSLVKEVGESIQLTTWKHKILIKGSTDQLVYADPFRISQVLSNLLHNSIKYSPKSGEIAIEIHSNTKYVTVSVKDSGIGIPKDKQDKIFERFYRVFDKTRESYPGLGIGLYIAAEIIKRYKGKIWLASTEGKGSKFYFALPVYNLEKAV